MNRRLIVPLVALLLGVALLATAAYVTLRQPGVGAPAPSAIGGAFALIDRDGKAITHRDMLGRPYLVFFGFTHCPDICPTTAMEISQLFEALGKDTKVNALFITVDPERDTAPILKDYLSSFDQRIVGVTGPRDSIDAAMKSFRAYARKVPSDRPDTYTMDHTALVYLMDKQGRFVSGFNLKRAPEEAARDLRRYL
ncbi:MAG: SCO family protein [Beijerinckiaceae bacterium]|nr:SCO family protein [Beijerinckiaceae bacterium]